jgi:hypothetical protein
LWKKISTSVENWDNLLIIGYKDGGLPRDFIFEVFSFIGPRNPYYQGNFGCGKLEIAESRNWPKPNLTLPGISGSLMKDDNRVRTLGVGGTNGRNMVKGPDFYSKEACF